MWKQYVAWTQSPQGPPFLFPAQLHRGADGDAHYQSRPHCSIIQRRNKPPSQRADQMCDAPRPERRFPGCPERRPRRITRFVDLLAAGGWACPTRVVEVAGARAAHRATRQTQCKVLQNFKCSLNTKDCAVHPGSSAAVSPGVTARRAGNSTGLRVFVGSGGVQGRRTVSDTPLIRLNNPLSPCTTGGSERTSSTPNVLWLDGNPLDPKHDIDGLLWSKS